jgi:hypothetical protein
LTFVPQVVEASIIAGIAYALFDMPIEVCFC